MVRAFNLDLSSLGSNPIADMLYELMKRGGIISPFRGMPAFIIAHLYHKPVTYLMTRCLMSDLFKDTLFDVQFRALKINEISKMYKLKVAILPLVI